MSASPKKINFLQFQTIDEPWNIYKLEDGTTVRVREIVAGLIKDSDSTFALQTTHVFNVIPHERCLGLPSPMMKPNEKLEDFIEAEDLKILEKTDNWNEYDVSSDNMRLSVKGEVVSVSRTNRHDERGIPIYIINVQLLVKHKKKTK